MSDRPFWLSRRRLLVGTAAASAVTFTGPAVAVAAPTRTVDPAASGVADSAVSGAAPVTRDRIATATIRGTDGRLTALRFQVDLHEQLGGWLAFWSANSPSSWSEPVEVTGRTDPAGRQFTLVGLRYRYDDQVRTGFAADRTDRAYWATLASLHHHFAVVRPTTDGIQVSAGPAGFTGTAEQVAFTSSVLRELWGYRHTVTGLDWAGSANRALRRAGQPAEIASRTGWAAFTRTSLRLGLNTETY